MKTWKLSRRPKVAFHTLTGTNRLGLLVSILTRGGL